MTFHRTGEPASAVIGHPADSNASPVVKLLRAIAGGTDAKASRHDVIFSAAANRIERLEADLLECQEYFADRMDVVDGDYGEPAPNKEMRLHQMIDESLNGRPY